MLIRLKAATMSPSTSDAELRWRFQTWRRQYLKEIWRMAVTCGYTPVLPSGETAGNIDEDEVDAGWHYPLPREELHAQFLDLSERLERMPGLDAAIEFWQDRTDTDEEVETTMAIHDTESEAETADEGETDNSTVDGVEVTDEDDQEMTEEGENEDEDEADNRTEGEVEATDEENQEMTDVGENEDEDEADKTTEEESETSDEDYEETTDKSESENEDEDGDAEGSTSSQIGLSERVSLIEEARLAEEAESNSDS